MSGNAPRMVFTSSFRPGSEFIVRSGRSTRNVRNALTLLPGPSPSSAYPLATTTKSRKFQASVT